MSFRITHAYTCAYWRCELHTSPFTPEEPVLARLARGTSTNTHVSAVNVSDRPVNFALQFYESIASRPPILFPTSRSDLFGHFGQFPPARRPVVWLNYNTNLVQGHLMAQYLLPATDGGKPAFRYHWSFDGWWQLLSDGPLAVTAFLEQGAGLGYPSHSMADAIPRTSHALSVVETPDHPSIGDDMNTNFSFPSVQLLPTSTEEPPRGGETSGGTPRALPTITPSLIDDDENEVRISYLRDPSMPTDRFLVVLRNPFKVKLKKLARFATQQVETAAYFLGPQVTEARMSMTTSAVQGKELELWQTGFLWIDYLKYKIRFDDTSLLGGGTLYIDWNRDGPR